MDERDLQKPEYFFDFARSLTLSRSASGKNSSNVFMFSKKRAPAAIVALQEALPSFRRDQDALRSFLMRSNMSGGIRMAVIASPAGSSTVYVNGVRVVLLRNEQAAYSRLHTS